MAIIYAKNNDWAKAAEQYERTADSLGSSTDAAALVSVNMGVGRSYENLAREATEKGNAEAATKAKAKAVEAYQVAADNAGNDAYTHERLKSVFTTLGKPDLAAQEQKAIDDLHKAEAEQNKLNAEKERAMELSRPKRPMGPSPVAPQ